jgi:acetoin utilization deacetylase AcuC-like enzyme
MKIVYSDGYDLNLGDHVFPSVKYRLARERLLERGLAHPSDFVEPERATDEQVLLVHRPEYVGKLKSGRLSREELRQLEVPYSREFIEAVWLGAGGTLEACRRALSDGVAVTICGGFHHAFPDHGEGFCALNDVAIAIRSLQHEGRIRDAMIIDCDVHHGNGTAAIFRGDPSVFTLSIHQRDNYPFVKPASNIDIDLRDGTGDEEYLALLADGLERALAALQPELMVYLAGADPYRGDQLGGLALTIEGLERRDRLVLGRAHSGNIPVAVTLAGGYAQNVDDTVEIHVNTVKAALEVFTPRQ